MHSDGGGRRGAAILLLYTLTFGQSAAVCATAEEPDASDSAERYGIDPARLGAVPAESRALFAEVLDRLETMRGEMDGLRADKAALAERVTRLEEKDCDETRAEEKQEEQEEDDDDEGARDQLTQKTTVMDATNSTRRRAQVGQACERVRDFQALTAAAMDACCPMSGGGHRRMQASCDLPVACPSAACAAVFVPYMTDCAAMVAATPGVPVVDFQSLASSCVEMQAGAGQMMQPVAVQMFRVMVNTEGAAQTGAMFPGGDENGGAGQPLDPLQPLSPAPPPSPDVTEGGDKTAVQQYHAVCTTADVASCVPACNAEHHGYELLATIDGTDTKYSCNLAHGLYSWMGAASEGGYLGADSASFLSAVLSGAAGAFVLTLTGGYTDRFTSPSTARARCAHQWRSGAACRALLGRHFHGHGPRQRKCKSHVDIRVFHGQDNGGSTWCVVCPIMYLRQRWRRFQWSRPATGGRPGIFERLLVWNVRDDLSIDEW
jgi:hypothetical protein